MECFFIIKLKGKGILDSKYRQSVAGDMALSISHHLPHVGFDEADTYEATSVEVRFSNDRGDEPEVAKSSDPGDVHTQHCCARCGCKYGDDDCTVTTGSLKQHYACGGGAWCGEDMDEFGIAKRMFFTDEG